MSAQVIQGPAIQVVITPEEMQELRNRANQTVQPLVTRTTEAMRPIIKSHTDALIQGSEASAKTQIKASVTNRAPASIEGCLNARIDRSVEGSGQYVRDKIDQKVDTCLRDQVPNLAQKSTDSSVNSAAPCLRKGGCV